MYMMISEGTKCSEEIWLGNGIEMKGKGAGEGAWICQGRPLWGGDMCTETWRIRNNQLRGVTGLGIPSKVQRPRGQEGLAGILERNVESRRTWPGVWTLFQVQQQNEWPPRLADRDAANEWVLRAPSHTSPTLTQDHTCSPGWRQPSLISGSGRGRLVNAASRIN